MRVIRGKLAVVTGAGSGIGRAIALRLAREGANLHLLDIDLPAAERVAEEARRLGVEAASTQCDVSQLAELEAAVAEIRRRWTAVAILVNNAGIAWYGHSLKMPADDWDKLLAINLHAPIHLSRLLLPVMLKQPEAHIVNMASISGWVCGARMTAYHASKFGLIGFSEALRAEFLARKIGVTAVCPGPVKTNLYRASETSYTDRDTPEPPAWLCTTPERVAGATIRAIYRNKAIALVSPMAWLLYYSKRLAPWIFYTLHHFGQKRKKSKGPEAKSPPKPPADERRAA
ncbi:MAG: SDR family oxidoreductase [Pirellulaceae bacterium]|nr:SDR family oxidoreductase [Pirellulaceae bacterium]